MMQIKVMQNLLAANDAKAAELRAKLHELGILMINMISSPGSGKTSLLEASLGKLKERYRVAVIEGDVETDQDAKRLDHYGVPVALINTSGACHLESVSIEKALSALDLANLDLIIVENVGNLVCPAEFDIGEDEKVALLSVPEGEDKVLKYPLLFHEASLVILNKIDLMANCRFNKEQFYDSLRAVNPGARVIETSCVDSVGLNEWIDWLSQKIITRKQEGK